MTSPGGSPRLRRPTSSLMHEALTGLLDRADLAVGAARAFLPADSLEPISRVAIEARTRMLYPEDVLVVALAGGTGSGKSSLFNLLTGTEAAEVGVSRPTTSEALAAVPERHSSSFDSFLAELGVGRKVVQDRMPGVCLLDLPDTDSVETDHRLWVEAIIPRVDVMVWVVDPEKYRDAALHHRYLQPLAGYASQFVVVLNQTDRLDGVALESVMSDLAAALVEDGLDGVPLIGAAAAPPSGPPIGVVELAAALGDLVDRPDLLFSKLLTDLERVSSDLVVSVGEPLGYRKGAQGVVSEAAHLILVGDRNDAVDRLVEFVQGLADGVEGPMSQSLRELAGGFPKQVHEISVPEVTPKKWWRRVPVDDDHRSRSVSRSVDGLLAPVEELLALRAQAAAAATDLALEIGTVTGRLNRET